MNTPIEKIGVKIASALLLHYGEVSKEDIRAFPFLTRPTEAETVIKNLVKSFNVEIYPRRISSYPLLEWEEVITLREKE